MRQNVLQIDPYAAQDLDSIATSQTPAAGGEQALTIDGSFASGGVATLDTPRQVRFTFAGDETGRSFLVTGTRRDGKQVVEAVAGTDTNEATTVQAFATVTEILIDRDSDGAITVGTLTIVSTSWFPMDYIRNPVNVGMVITIGGATDVTVELTLSNLMSRRGNDPLPTVGHHVGSKFKLIYPVVNPIDHDSLVNVSVDSSGNVAFPITGLRLTSNAVVVGDPVIMEFAQAGHRGA
jgi:hypothetical protein